jgi:hypothetical protein
MKHSLPGAIARACVTVACLASAAAAGAADTPPTGGRIVTMTRGMKVFGDAESALLRALASKDNAGIDALVDPSFEQRNGATPGEPLPHDEWIEKAAAESSASDRLSQMAVHDHGDLVVVSFVLQHAGRGDAFVVDVWRKGEAPGKYLLATRYYSAAALPSGGRNAHAAASKSGTPVDTRK